MVVRSTTFLLIKIMEKELHIQVRLKNVENADASAGRGPLLTIMNSAAEALVIKIRRAAKIGRAAKAAKAAEITK